MSLRRPRRLRPGDRLALVAPSSPFPRDSFEAGIHELRSLGFEPVFDEQVFAIDEYEAGPAVMRAGAVRAALEDPSVAGIVAVRGGYGAAKVVPLLDPELVCAAAKPLVGYSDLTTLLAFFTTRCGLAAFHGPMLDARLSRGAEGYDRDTFLRAVCDAAPLGELRPDGVEVLRPGEARGLLLGGTLTSLAASLGTPFAFDPPQDCVLFIEDVNERPYRIDRMLTQLVQAGVVARARGIVFGEMRGCDEPVEGGPTARGAILRALAGFPGPVLFNFPSGHTAGPCWTLPLGVTARVVGTGAPALVIEEPAVE